MGVKSIQTSGPMKVYLPDNHQIAEIMHEDERSSPYI